MYKIYDNEQGTDKWFEDRLGKITASVASKIITRTGRPSSSSDEVVNRAVAELILKYPDETFQSDAMQRGKELEDQALKYFNFVYGYGFKKCGFIEAVGEGGELLGFGASPDGLDLKIKTGLELKCPEAHMHLSYLAGKKLPDKYFQQVQTAMMVTGFKTWVFGSYFPNLPCFKVEVERDDKFISSMRALFVKTRKTIKERHLELAQMLKDAS